MKRGVRFEIPNEYGRFIAEVLQPVNYFEYDWYIDSDQIWLNETGGLEGKALFTNRCISGTEFFKLINDNEYYVIFSIIKAFPKNSTETKIINYRDFLNSKCDIIMLVADSCYVDLYCKNIMLIDKFYNNAKSKNYKNIEYINENDSRTGMYV